MPENTYSEDEVQALIAQAKEAAAAEAKGELTQQLAQQQYGAPAAGGGAQPHRSEPRSGSWEEANELIKSRLEKGNGLGDSAGKQAFSRWVGRRIAEAAEFSMRTPSYRSFSAKSADDKQIRDDRIARRSKQGGSL